MFYAHFVLAKKGPLARIWLAAHWDKKLTKAHVFETNIESSVEGILQPKVKMALRTSGHLLLGIVRIYSRKAKYLLADCNEAFIKIKMAFRPGVVDLPEENREAAVATITLPEVFHDFDAAMPDINNIDVDAPVTLNQSRAEDITLKEDYGSLSLMADDDGFGDMGFDDPEMARDATNIDEGFDHASLLLGEDKLKDKNDDASASSHNATDDLVMTKASISLVSMKDDAFGGAVGETLLDSGGGLFEPGGLFDDAPLGHIPLDNNAETSVPGVSGEMQAAQKGDISDDDDDMYDMGPASMGPPSGPSSPDTLPPPDVESATNGLPPPPPMVLPPPPPPPPPPPQEPVVPDQTTLIHNEDESFALAPLDSTVMPGIERSKAKRKRKLIVDEVKNISGEEMKSQLSDTTDIVTTLDLAPPTKRLMHWKETGGVEKLFALPGRPMLSRTQSRLYQRHLTTRAVENEEMGGDDQMDLEEEMEHALPPPPPPPPVPAPVVREEETPIAPPPKRSKGDSALHEEELARLEPSVDNSFMPLEQVSHPELHLSMDHLQPETHLPTLPPPPSVQQHQDSFIFSHPEPEPLHSLAPIEQPPLDLQTPVMSPPPPLNLHPNSMAMSPVVPELTNIPSFDGVQQKEIEETLPNENLQENEEPTLNHKAPIYDDDEDYGAPASVGPPEEQLADETYEQFEERIINKRTVHMLHIIQHSVEFGGKVNFRDLVHNNRRKQVAQKFYTFLVLKKQQAVELEQDEPYGDLIITRGPKFSVVY